jgi:hypothetical protein
MNDRILAEATQLATIVEALRHDQAAALPEFLEAWRREAARSRFTLKLLITATMSSSDRRSRRPLLARKPFLNTRDRPGAHLGLTRQISACMQRCDFLQILSAHRKVTADQSGVVSMKQNVDDPLGEFRHVPLRLRQSPQLPAQLAT